MILSNSTVNKPSFSKKYFEVEIPRLLKLVDHNGRPPCIILTLEEGDRVELRDFQVDQNGLTIAISSEQYFIPLSTIQGIQIIPQDKRHLLLAKRPVTRKSKRLVAPFPQS